MQLGVKLLLITPVKRVGQGIVERLKPLARVCVELELSGTADADNHP
jgi:hypothetical protein